MNRGGKREGAGRPRTNSSRRSIPGDILEIVEAMLYQHKEHGIREFNVTFENEAGIQTTLNTAPVTKKPAEDGKARIYIDAEMRPMIQRTERAVAVFVGDIVGVRAAFDAMRKGMDLETLEFLASINGLEKETGR